ncbi:hypothetical protein [Pengzhenrongella phosphoraccumulans]|uniref:hypothetical protein n=1 Tax=Pengzhenrongella phosphoraccumulans TaxID=3114394 RepID=UPI00388D9EFA
MQRSRRTTPYPFTWEIPVGTLLAVLLALVLGLQAGRSLANLVAGNGWVFVDRVALFTTLGPLLSGQADAGLPAVIHPAPVGLLWTSVGIVQLLVISVIGWAVKFGLDRWGPARLRGMATAAQAEALLGRTRLRRHAKVIRPDLYGAPHGGRR